MKYSKTEKREGLYMRYKIQGRLSGDPIFNEGLKDPTDDQLGKLQTPRNNPSVNH